MTKEKRKCPIVPKQQLGMKNISPGMYDTSPRQFEINQYNSKIFGTQAYRKIDVKSYNNNVAIEKGLYWKYQSYL